MKRLILVSAIAFGLGCADSASGGGSADPSPSPTSAPSANTGSTGVSQAGAQDFGLFRDILERGELPAPSALDDLGFFAEHKLDYPKADCGDDLCMHGLLGIGGNLMTGATCTLVQIGLNTPIDPSTLERPPLNLVLSIDVSGSMSGDPIAYVRSGLVRMLDYLEPTDRVSLVAWSGSAVVMLDSVGMDQRVEIEKAIGSLVADGGTNLYDGLFTALQVATSHAKPGLQNRVILLSDGVANLGITSAAKMRSLAESYAKAGIGITTIGVGTAFDVGAMRDIAEVGAGSFYFLDEPAAVKEVFTEEVKTFLMPIALDVRIDVSVGSGYRIANVYGTNGWHGGATGGEIGIPSLFLAGRKEASAPIDGGRRGGGGAMLVELIRIPGSPAPEPKASVGSLFLTWTHPTTGLEHSQEVHVDVPGMSGDDGWFSSPTVEKGFLMLNLYAGFHLASTLAADSDTGAARGVLEALRPGVASWLVTHADPDIEDDLAIVDLFVNNLMKAQIQTTVQTPPEPWPID